MPQTEQLTQTQQEALALIAAGATVAFAAGQTNVRPPDPEETDLTRSSLGARQSAAGS